MIDDERQQAYAALREMAVDQELAWVVEQAEEEIRGGRTVALTESIVVKLPGRRRSSRIEKRTRTGPFRLSRFFLQKSSMPMHRT